MAPPAAPRPPPSAAHASQLAFGGERLDAARSHGYIPQPFVQVDITISLKFRSTAGEAPLTRTDATEQFVKGPWDMYLEWYLRG